MKRGKVSTKEEEMTNTTREERMKKVRNLVILLKKELKMNIRVIMIKSSMLL